MRSFKESDAAWKGGDGCTCLDFDELISHIGDIDDISEALSSPQKTLKQLNLPSGVHLTPLEMQVVLLKKKHPDCLLLVECGYRMRFFGKDAEVF